MVREGALKLKQSCIWIRSKGNSGNVVAVEVELEIGSRN